MNYTKNCTFVNQNIRSQQSDIVREFHIELILLINYSIRKKPTEAELNTYDKNLKLSYLLVVIYCAKSFFETTTNSSRVV
jgi:hypothetical protein